ncbi:hypothetical protein SALBM135S_04632 [Streptomyces alboniger]
MDDLPGVPAAVRGRGAGARRASRAAHLRGAQALRRGRHRRAHPRRLPGRDAGPGPQEGAALLDLQALSLALWDKLGAEETKRYFNWTATEQDNTHFNPLGAIAVARVVAAELLRRRVLSPGDVRRLDGTVPESWITWPHAPEEGA